MEFLKDNPVFVTMLVVSAIWLVIAVFLFVVDKRLKRIEKRIDMIMEMKKSDNT